MDVPSFKMETEKISLFLGVRPSIIVSLLFVPLEFEWSVNIWETEETKRTEKT